jgi:hypothetical protein
MADLKSHTACVSYVNLASQYTDFVGDIISSGQYGIPGYTMEGRMEWCADKLRKKDPKAWSQP